MHLDKLPERSAALTEHLFGLLTHLGPLRDDARWERRGKRWRAEPGTRAS